MLIIPTLVMDLSTYQLQGMASTYYDKKTASAELMDRNALTAAHRTLPFNTKVLVQNKRNNKKVTVRINDRGPYIRGRIIDLSPKAARILDLDGLAPVRLTVKR